ncbi:MAG: DUF4910 domain-containing protein [Candidatus Nanoarchaeia archaeon]
MEMYELLKELFPICRSITGEGVRKTLAIISRYVPELKVTEIPSGTQCFDWTIPEEWNIKSAFIRAPDGRIIADFAKNNLHVLSYSIPVEGYFSLEELNQHLYSDESRPGAIPYRTSYYERRWGFCISHNERLSLKAGNYYVKIDSELKNGSLTIADAIIPGEIRKEIFFSCYLCHPSMADDSLSGVVLAARLYEHFKNRKNQHTFRFIFVPETIGAIAYLHKHGKEMKRNTNCGIVLTCLGAEGEFNYKKTRQGKHELDRIMENVLKHSNHKYKIYDFFLPGSDERQYSSPGFALPVGALMHSYYSIPKYHSSEDNLDNVSEKCLQESFDVLRKTAEALDENCKYKTLKPYCEPFLSKYDLCGSVGANVSMQESRKRIMYLLNFSDGYHSLLDIAEKGNFELLNLADTAKLLESKGLLKKMKGDMK